MKHKIINLLAVNFGLFLTYGMLDWAAICAKGTGIIGLLLSPVTLLFYPIHLYREHKIVAFAWFIVTLITLPVFNKLSGGSNNEKTI